MQDKCTRVHFVNAVLQKTTRNWMRLQNTVNRQVDSVSWLSASNCANWACNSIISTCSPHSTVALIPGIVQKIRPLTILHQAFKILCLHLQSFATPADICTYAPAEFRCTSRHVHLQSFAAPSDMCTCAPAMFRCSSRQVHICTCIIWLLQHTCAHMNQQHLAGAPDMCTCLD